MERVPPPSEELSASALRRVALREPMLLSMVVEGYRRRHGLSARQAVEALSQSGALRYWAESYEALHMMGLEATLWYVEEWMSQVDRG